MYIIEKLKLNRFKNVAIPKASALYARIGNTGLPSSAAYTGDEQPPLFERKTDTISRSMQDYEQYAREEAARNSHTDDE